MRVFKLAIIFAAMLGSSSLCLSDDVGVVKNAVERSTLNQPGTKPFHLKAIIAPTRDSDVGSNRTGEVEIWWTSPTQYKQEVTSPEFHQVDIVSGGREWQKSDGEYFPEWLREIAVELISPVPPLDEVLKQVDSSDVKKLGGTTHYSWMTMSTDGNVQTAMGAGVSVTDGTGLLYYGNDLGWGCMFQDYKDFHGRMVARTVSAGSPEVTAKITILEDLIGITPGFFDAEASGGDTQQLRTLLVGETALRKNMLPAEPVVWPPLQDGPLEGAVTTNVVVDRAGKVREIGTIVTNNPGVSETAGKAIAAMQFEPYLQDGIAVQVVSRVSMPFKTTRPAGVETFESARSYFERGRIAGFPAAGTGASYVLRASFKAGVKAGTVEAGEYVDTWNSDSEWRREATIGKSRYVRARNGEKRYLLAEGPDAGLLRFVLMATEPIPAIDTFVESDWRIKSDTVDGTKTVRVLTGYENPNGTLDPEHARGFWFDTNGNLVKAFFQNLEIRRSAFQDFNGAQVAREVRVLRNNQLAMFIQINQLSTAVPEPSKTFELRGHEWTRAFTAEVR